MNAHGTRSHYVGGCRCEPCTEANRLYMRELDRHHRRVAYGIEAPRPERHVDATEARDHLRWLSSVGVGRRTVAERTGLSPTTVREITTGETRRCAPETSAKILAVGRYDRPGAALVDATETRRKVAELLAHGWTRIAIARAISGPNARQLQIGRGERVLASTAEKVARLHAHALAHVIEERRIVAERQAAYRSAKREAAA